MKATYSILRRLRIRDSVVVLILCAVSVRAVDSCNSRLFTGFDSRLEVAFLNSLPKDKDEILDFEVAKDRVFIAKAKTVIGVRGKNEVVLPSAELINGLAVQGDNLLLQTRTGIKRLGPDGQLPDVTLTSRVKGQVVDSGSQTLLDVKQQGTELNFVLLNPNGRVFRLLKVPGALRATSWSDNGFAAIVDHTLYYWSPGSKQLLRVADDMALASATSICIVGPERIVIGLKTVMIVVDHKHMSVLVAMHGICRFNHGVLYLLDTTNGLLWAVRNIESVGRKDDDERYAEKLLNTPQGSDDNSAQFLEAARILGCDKARQHSGTTARGSN